MLASPSDPREPHRGFVVAARGHRVRLLIVGDGILAVVPRLSGPGSHPEPSVALARLSRRIGGFELVQAPADDAIEVFDTLLLDRLRQAHGRVPDDEPRFHRLVEDLAEGGILEWRT